MRGRRFKKVVGAVSPIEWGRMGEPKRFSIFTEWGEDYVVVNKSQESLLKPYVNRVVEAHGQIYKNDEGDKFLNLKSVNLIGSPGSTPAEVQPFLNDGYEELPIHIPQREGLYGDLHDWDEMAVAV